MGRMKRTDEQTYARVDEILEGAAAVFIARGYRRTTMADVAAALDLSPGTLYLYFEGKEALFHWLVIKCLRDDWAAEIPGVPAGNPGPGATRDVLHRAIARVVAESPLGWPIAEDPADAAGELEAVLRSLHATLRDFRRAIDLVERSAADWPELGEVVDQTLHGGMLDGLSRYLSTRMRRGYFAPVPDVPAAAQLVLQSLTLSARGGRGDNPRVRETVLALILRAFAPGGEQCV